MITLFLIALLPLGSFGQLVLGFCPEPPKFIKDLKLEKYSGKWYAVAQSRYHPMGAQSCQFVEYTPRSEDGLDVHYEAIGSPFYDKKETGGKMHRETGKSPGELKLKMEDLAISLQFRVLHVDYSDVAVEYTCLPGVLSPLLSVTVLQRKPPAQGSNLHSVLESLNLSNVIPQDLKENMLLINNNDCQNRNY